MVGMVDLCRAGAVGPAQSPGVGDDRLLFAAGGGAVIGPAGEIQLVGVGTATPGPVRRMMHLTVIARLQTVGPGAAPITDVADQPLIGGGHPFLPSQVQRPLEVVVEDRQ